MPSRDLSILIGLGLLLLIGFVARTLTLQAMQRRRAAKGSLVTPQSNLWGKVFIVSAGLAIALLSMNSLVAGNTAAPPNEPDTLTVGSLLTTLASCTASLISLTGFIVTTTLALRKEKREARAATLDWQRQALELQRQKMELEKLKEEMKTKKKRDR